MLGAEFKIVAKSVVQRVGAGDFFHRGEMITEFGKLGINGERLFGGGEASVECFERSVVVAEVFRKVGLVLVVSLLRRESEDGLDIVGNREGKGSGLGSGRQAELS